MKYIKISYNKNMKKLIVTILLVSVLTCGCSFINKEEALGVNVSQSNVALQFSDQGNVVNEEQIQQTNKKEVIENITPQKTEEHNINTEELHPIEIEEQKCMKKADYTTTGMSECSYKAMDMWFKEIDKYLGLLKTVTSEEEYSNILKAQENWKKYQESEFVAISIIINKQGTIFQNILSGCETGLVKQRAVDLKNLYERLTLD